MPNQLPKLAIGLVAGLAAGLMALAGFKAGMAMIALLFVAPITVYIAALGWGPLAGVVAAILASAVIAFDSGMEAASVAAAMLFAPAAWGGHLANLAQPSGDGRTLDWYPVSGILSHLMLAVAAATVLAGYMTGFSEERIAAVFRELFESLQKSRPDLTPPPRETLDAASRFYAGIIPFAVPAMWLMLHVLALRIASQITRLSDKLPRPAEDIAATAQLPAAMLALPVLGILAMAVAPSPAYDIGAVAAGVGAAGFGLVGLAQLHLVTRGQAGRGPILFFTYLALVIVGLPILAFAAMGVLRTLRPASSPSSAPPAKRKKNGRGDGAE